MITTSRILSLVALATVLVSSTSFALFRINLFRPYDINLRTERYPGDIFQVTGWAEIGTKTRAYGRDGHHVNPLQMYQYTHNAIAMLGGVQGQNAEQKKLLQRVSMLSQFTPRNPITSTTAPLQGHMRFTGDFKYKAGFGVNARYLFPYDISLALFVPFYSMQLKHVEIQDLTSQENIDPQDVKVRQLVTDNFKQVVAEFDPSLNLNGWNKTGIGDIALMLEWWRNFPQGKPVLKNVSINARGGLSLPTGVKTDVNDIFSVPFGCDGSTAIIIGAGIDLDWFNCLPFINQLRGGLDVQFWQIFGNTRERRIKTAANQTDILSLVKARAYIDPGFAQQYNLYLQAHHLFKGLSLGTSYQFVKESRSNITLFDNTYSELIANSSKALKAWKVYQLLFTASYDIDYDGCPETVGSPQFKLMYKVPVGGKRVIACDTVTAVVSFNF